MVFTFQREAPCADYGMFDIWPRRLIQRDRCNISASAYPDDNRE